MKVGVLMSLAGRLRNFRGERKLSLAALAEESNMSETYLWRLENGRSCNPSVGVLYKLAAALDMSIVALLEESVRVDSVKMADLPANLRDFIEESGEELDISEEDIEMLLSIEYRGRQPSTKEEWEFIFRSIKMTLGRHELEEDLVWRRKEREVGM